MGYLYADLFFRKKLITYRDNQEPDPYYVYLNSDHPLQIAWRTATLTWLSRDLWRSNLIGRNWLESLFLPKLWKTISRDPVIGFIRFWTCLEALDLDYMYKKRVFDLDYWLRNYFVLKMGYIIAPICAWLLYLITLFYANK